MVAVLEKQNSKRRKQLDISRHQKKQNNIGKGDGQAMPPVRMSAHACVVAIHA
jgi:hypothetical protein